MEEHVLLDQVLARHGREHRTGLLGIQAEVMGEVPGDCVEARLVA